MPTYRSVQNISTSFDRLYATKKKFTTEKMHKVNNFFPKKFQLLLEEIKIVELVGKK